MNKFMRLPVALAAACTIFLAQPGPVSAAPLIEGIEGGDGAGCAAAPQAAGEHSALHADFEIDPLAYVLSGFSLHVGIGYRRVRLDLGNFAIAVPAFVHGNDGFDQSFTGYGAKVQYFPFAEQNGFFLGVDGGVSWRLTRREGTDLAARRQEVGVGVHVGYRIALPASFYVTPWIGVGYSFGGKDETLAGATAKSSPIVVFPAIHLGYRFR